MNATVSNDHSLGSLDGPRGRGDVARAFGSVLRTARQEIGLTQDGLSERMGFDRTYPSLLERGLRAPSLWMVLRFGEALNRAPEQLVADTVALLRKEGS
jgi:transcriptional regulator with XRE-family HTH domain